MLEHFPPCRQNTSHFAPIYPLNIIQCNIKPNEKVSHTGEHLPYKNNLRTISQTEPNQCSYRLV